MKIETFTLRSNDTGGIATLRQVHPDCGGSNISPQLSWINSPQDTRSFAITMFDKDAPVDGGFWHWRYRASTITENMVTEARIRLMDTAGIITRLHFMP